jgi:hypothetical protein
MRCELAIGEKKVCVRWKLFRIVQRDYEHNVFSNDTEWVREQHQTTTVNKSIISKLRSSLITGLCTCAILLQHKNPPYFTQQSKP